MTSSNATATTASPANHEPLTPLAFLPRSATTFPDREALIYGQRRMSYAEFESEVQKLARSLAQSVTQGQVVSFVAPNTPEMLIAHYAVPLIGAVLNPLNPRLSGREFSYILEHAESQIVFVDSEVADVVADVADRIQARRQRLHHRRLGHLPEHRRPAISRAVAGQSR